MPSPASSTARVASAWLPLAFVVFGLVALAVVPGWIVLQPELLASYHYNQQIVSLTHLFVLGWIGSVLMGAMYQLVPVALETRLHSERLSRWHAVLHMVGVTGMVIMFHTWNLKQVGHFGSILAAGVGLFAWNLARTLARIPRWNVVAAGVAAALGWFCLTILAGLYLASAKCWPRILPFPPIAAMHAHAHLGVLGAFLMLIVGVSYRLIPMFALTEIQDARRAWAALGLMNIALTGLIPSILFGSRFKFFFAALFASGLITHAIEVTAMLRARRRRPLDWGLKHLLTALALLGPVTALGLLLAWPGLPATVFTTQLENVYGFLGLAGVITLAIVGMLYKIVPFLVWSSAYSRRIGLMPVPALADLYSTRLQIAGYLFLLAGLLTACVGAAASDPTTVRLGGTLLGISITTLLVNVSRMLSHLVRPRIVAAVATRPEATLPASPQLTSLTMRT